MLSADLISYAAIIDYLKYSGFHYVTTFSNTVEILSYGHTKYVRVSCDSENKQYLFS
jgi:hypothetical protein